MSVTPILMAGTDLDVVNSARVSLNVEHDTLTDADEGLIRRLMRDGHTSTLTGVWAKFKISCSIGCSRQIARHGHYLEINEYSTRYSEVPPHFVVPTLKRQTGKAMDYQFEALGDDDEYVAHRIIDEGYESAHHRYEMLLEMGVAREDARSVLPLGTTTHLIVSCHLKGWLRFLAQRLDPHAQDEIRAIAVEIERHLICQAPKTMAAWAVYGSRQP